MVAIEALEELLEKLLHDDDTKDVDIEMEDGSLRAHSCMLSAASEAMRGMLRHGVAATKDVKTLSWKEHPMEVGQFFLRLLYTGTVAEEEWSLGATDEHGGSGGGRASNNAAAGAQCGGSGEERDTVASSSTPLRLLLGALSIAKIYQVPHLLHALVEALKARLDDESFDEIYAGAIKMDVTALRLHCLRYAERSDIGEIIEGARVRALRHITVQNADVPQGSIGTVNSNRVIEWDDTGSIGYGTDVELVRGMVHLISSPALNRVRELYTAKALAPEVMFELAALWGPTEQSYARRRSL